MELIDRAALIAEYDRVHVGAPGGARKMMEDAPTIDAVPVVRCHKCKRSRPLNQNDPFEMRFSEECVWCVEHCNAMIGDDFCSYGERKDNA